MTTTGNRPLLPHHYRLHELFPDEPDRRRDAVRDRVLILGNGDVRITYVVANTESPLYSNGIGDEVVFIESGPRPAERLRRSKVRQGDNIVMPRVTIHRWIPDDVEQNGPLRLLCVEGAATSAADKYRRGTASSSRGRRSPSATCAARREPLADAEEAGHDTEVYVKHWGATGASPVGGGLRPPPVRRRRLGRTALPVRVQLPRLLAGLGERLQPPPTTRCSRARLRRLQLRAAPARVRRGLDQGARTTTPTSTPTR